MRNRREFLGDLSLAAAGASLVGCRATKVLTPTEAAARRLSQPRFMWAYLAHFGMKLWESRCHYADLKVDDSMWKSLTERAAEIGVNVFVIDLAEGMVFPSHPELAVRGSWEPERMHDEVVRLKKMGMIAVPKLNFSSSHDQWLGKWRPYLSTPEYFQVCSEVIDDVAAVFDETPLFNIGYDEESYFIQNVNKFPYVRLRRGELWWHDFLWFVNEVERRGMRAWMWSDYCWHHPDFYERCPRSVLQSNWLYEKELVREKITAGTPDTWDPRSGFEAYEKLEKARFDQVPCGSTWEHRENFGNTVRYCRKLIPPGRLKGFLMAPWYYRTQEDKREKIMTSLDVMAEAMREGLQG